MKNHTHELSDELQELFDIRNAKIKEEKNLTLAAMEAQRDIRLLTHMFSDGIPGIAVMISEEEKIIWDSSEKRLLYSDGEKIQILESAAHP